MALDPASIAEGFSKSGGYYLAGLLVVVVVPLFYLYREALLARTEDWKKRTETAEAKLDTERASRDAQHDRLLITADRVISIAGALEQRLPKPKPAKEASNG